MNHFKIIRGYSAEDYISIDETELEKAFYSFLSKKDAIYSGGAVRGSEILAIQPDYHRTMGWNRGYKLGVDDYAELRQKGIDKKSQQQLADSKEKIHYLISTNQEQLVGRGFQMPKIENSISKSISDLAESKRIK